MVEGVVVVVADDHPPIAPETASRPVDAWLLERLIHGRQDKARGATVQLLHEQRALCAAARARPALDDADLRRSLDGEGLQRALQAQPPEGPDGPVDRVRPAHADGL